MVEIRDVWKVFGAREQEAIDAIRRDGLGKAEVLEQYDCVIGVQDVTLTVHEGEIFCVMGLSGSGKSTLVRHINRLLEPSTGEIRIEGADVTQLSGEALRSLRAAKIGMVFQNFALLPHRTVRDNVALPLEIQGMPKLDRYDAAERCLEIVDLAGWGDKFAHELSGGMQQRVGLARALAADPDILLMDEPFSALDPLIRRQLQGEFMELSRRMKKTTLFITHDLDEAIRIGHRIAIMKDGRIVQIGTPEEIVTQPADDYVADFVAGISRLHLVYAHSVMRPLEEAGGASLERAPRVPDDADLDRLIDVALANEGPLVVTQGGRDVGIVEREDLLRGVRGEPATKEGAGARIAEVQQQASASEAIHEGQDELIREFTEHHAEHYVRAFRTIGTSRRFAFSFNASAALLGPIWAGARRMWGLFWIFALAELLALTPLSQGLFGDLGGEQALRAEQLLTRAEQREERARAAAEAGRDNADRLRESAETLKRAAEGSLAEAEAAATQAPMLIGIGVALLVLVKVLEGLLADGALGRRFDRWRADRTLGTGLSQAGAIAAGLLVLAVYPLTIYRFTVTQPLGWLVNFPADADIRSAAANGIDRAFDWLTVHGETLFDAITVAVRELLDALELALVATPWPVVMIVILAIAWRLAGVRVAIFTAAALAYFALFGFWENTMATIALLGAAAVICVVIGVPLGIWFAKSARAYGIARPVLDFMQTMPAFVYLIPVIAFFGTGKPPGILATLIFGMPPVIRLTALGMMGVPETVKEAARAFGATRFYQLIQVELPLAMPSIKTGINQTILMCLSMVVIASLIGAKGLGEEVLNALQYAAEGDGILAGLAILFSAMALDRIVQGRQARTATG